MRCMLLATLGLTLMGCSAMSQVDEHVGRQKTMNMLRTGYCACLATGETDDVCRGDLLTYRSCLDSGGSDAQCRAKLPE